ncbi:MAG: KilA-N domain-containing protein [Bacteroidales bacterium]|nr:KilA-N domain-containing protein [Bacteroidales bacterium]
MIVPKEFNGIRIDFDVFLREKNAMVNATQMAKIFNKDVPDFMILKNTKEFISECLKNQNSGFLGIKNEEDLVNSKQKSGTWMHRVLALKFAAWLNPAFDLWVFMTIEELLFGTARKMDASFKRTLEIQEEMNVLEEKADKSGIDFERYLLLQDELKNEKSNRKRTTSERIKNLQMTISFQTSDE